MCRAARDDDLVKGQPTRPLGKEEVAQIFSGDAHDPPAIARAEPDALLCFTGLAAGLGATYESHRRAVCCYPAPRLPRRQVTPLGFIPIYSGRFLRRDPTSGL